MVNVVLAIVDMKTKEVKATDKPESTATTSLPATAVTPTSTPAFAKSPATATNPPATDKSAAAAAAKSTPAASVQSTAATAKSTSDASKPAVQRVTQSSTSPASKATSTQSANEESSKPLTAYEFTQAWLSLKHTQDVGLYAAVLQRVKPEELAKS